MFISSPHVPRWLQVLLTEKFYNACLIHEGIRRYMYQDVIRLDDAGKLVDCTSVQHYKTNSAKVVFLNQRPQPRNFKGSGNFCSTCDRSLQDPYQFCSLSCKINHLVGTKGCLSGYLLFECNHMSLPETGFDDCPMTPDSVLEPAGSGGVDCRTTLASIATANIVKKKRSGGPANRPACRPENEVAVGLMNRRKGNPQRAPLY
ncbi:hypothetical protein SESBI_43160 [Sesbania bispinosa]|nr:hypothetical protein SESBI_43160 [Sesbania bispinosa]